MAWVAISRSEVFMVMLGPRTIDAPSVLKEVTIAQELGKTRFQVIGYKVGTEEWAVPGSGRTYLWDWGDFEETSRIARDRGAHGSKTQAP
jgi:hypothetical protein